MEMGAGIFLQEEKNDDPIFSKVSWNLCKVAGRGVDDFFIGENKVVNYI